jgi:IS6 family transposase
VISVAVRWYLRYGPSYRDVEELLAERGVTVDHVPSTRWVQRFTPEFIEAPRPCRHTPGDRWFVDETYVKVVGQWAYLYRAVDQHGQVIDVLLSVRRDLAAARQFFTRAMHAGTIPVEVTTDRASVYPRVVDELILSAPHTVEQYANNPIEADHGRLKARLRPMRGVKRHRSARILAAGHASFRISAAATTTSQPTLPAATGSASPSMTSNHHLTSGASGIMLRAAQGWHNATVPAARLGSAGSPSLIVAGHLFDERGDVFAGRRRRSVGVGPVPADGVPVPAQQGSWRD